MQADAGYRSFAGMGAAERLFMALVAQTRLGGLSVTLPGGGVRNFEGPEPGPSALLRVHHPRFFRRMLTGGHVAFAEAYMDGDCDAADLTALLELAGLNEAAFGAVMEGQPMARLAQRLVHLVQPNTRRGAKRNIARHYDLGNEFYALWLDPSMTYSSAVYEHPAQALEAAQINKYRRIARLAGIEPGHHVLEVGCGWGGFAAWAAREIGCRVTAITISQAQHDYAARRLRAAGLGERVELRLQDYRELRGGYDRIVSIEMLEAVGESYWPRYFATLRDSLKPGGRAALQTIAIAEEFYEDYRRHADFIQRYIFPGGMLPTLSVLRRQIRDAGLEWRGAEGFGAHYARTLAVWRKAFDAAWHRVAPLGFDEQFRRMWRYYLAYCEAGFNIGRIDVLQAALSKA